AGFGETERGFFGAFLQVVAPAPGVAKAELREQVQGGVVGAAVAGGVAHEQVVGAGLGHGDAHVEVAVFVKDAGVGDLEFGIVQAARGVLRDETAVGVFGLWILVERLHPGVGRGGVEVVVEFLDVLAVVALGAGEAEETFLEDGVAAVPQGDGEGQAALAVTEAEQAVLAPAVGAAAGVFVREGFPGGAAERVVLADGGPLALGQVGAPAFPVAGAVAVLGQPAVLGGVAGGGICPGWGFHAPKRRLSGGRADRESAVAGNFFTPGLSHGRTKFP